MKKKWYLSIAALSLFLTVQEDAARAAIIINDENINQYQSQQSPMETEEILRGRLASQLNEAKQEFDKLGIPGLHQALIEQLPRVEIKKSECESGTVFRWMFFKNNGMPVEKNVIWEGKGPLVGYEFSIENDRKRYIFFVPSFGENIALKEIETVIMTACPPPVEKYVDRPVLREVVRTIPGPPVYVAVPNDVPVFPFPPPPATTSYEIENDLLVAAGRGKKILLKDVAEKLQAAFKSAGYADRKYYWVPEGFALVSRIERFNSDGTPKNPDRWPDDKFASSFDDNESFFKSYIASLFKAVPGRYRVVVFVVTTQPFGSSRDAVSRKEAMEWLRAGLNTLPESIGDELYNIKKHKCTALIYEFEQFDKGYDPLFKEISNLTAEDHLVKSNILSELNITRR